MNIDCCERVYLSGSQLSINYSASLYECNVLYRFSIYSNLGLACSLERYDMHSGMSEFPSPEDKGGSQLQKALCGSKGHILPKQVLRDTAGTRTHQKGSPRLMGFCFGVFYMVWDPCTHLAL